MKRPDPSKAVCVPIGHGKDAVTSKMPKRGDRVISGWREAADGEVTLVDQYGDAMRVAGKKVA